MPKLDGTGPQGKGPRTGRGLGKCVPKGNISKFFAKFSKNKKKAK